MFLEFWKRRQAVIAWEWDLSNYEDEEDARPEFEVKVRDTDRCGKKRAGGIDTRKNTRRKDVKSEGLRPSSL